MNCSLYAERATTGREGDAASNGYAFEIALKLGYKLDTGGGREEGVGNVLASHALAGAGERGAEVSRLGSGGADEGGELAEACIVLLQGVVLALERRGKNRFNGRRGGIDVPFLRLRGREQRC